MEGIAAAAAESSMERANERTKGKGRKEEIKEIN